MEQNIKTFKNWWVYLLLLENGKYYVGITSQTPEIRMQEHIDHVRGANWTKRYKPLEIIFQENLGQISKEEAEAYENKLVREYMKKFGNNNVRGGDLTKVDDYSKLFGYFYLKHDVDALKIMLFLVVAISVLYFLI